jgi:hypothetical protein
VNGKVVLGVLAMIGMLALSATVAHAGGGGTPVALTSFFVCHATTGPNLGTQARVVSDDLSIAQALIVIGQAIWTCAQANLFVYPEPDTGSQEILPNTASSQQELKCYVASPLLKKNKIVTDVTHDDALSGPVTAPIAQDIRLVCGPASQTTPPQ